MKTEVKVKRQIVYIAGKYRSRWGLPGRAWHIYKAWLAGRRLVKQGYSVYIPHLNTAFMDKLQPDEFFLEATRKMLPKCQIIYMIGAWATSQGAIAELMEAKKRGLKVWFESRTEPEMTLDEISSGDELLPFTAIEDCNNPVTCQMEGKDV